jgi:hypothetical protein
MNKISQFVLDTKNAFTVYGDYNAENYVNADKFGAQERFNDMWNDCQSNLMIKYSLPPFHLWESGYEQGDASDEEIKMAVENINKGDAKQAVSKDTIFEFLDDKFLELIGPKANQLIKDYNTFCKKELAKP